MQETGFGLEQPRPLVVDGLATEKMVRMPETGLGPAMEKMVRMPETGLGLAYLLVRELRERGVGRLPRLDHLRVRLPFPFGRALDSRG
jgi:hypothetical protein